MKRNKGVNIIIQIFEDDYARKNVNVEGKEKEKEKEKGKPGFYGTNEVSEEEVARHEQ